MNVLVHRQKRKSLAFTLTKGKAVVLIPHTLTEEHPIVQAFIERSLKSISITTLPMENHGYSDIQPLIEKWSQCLKVSVKRIQIRRMTRKWGSMSSIGNLTLSSDLYKLPLELVEYVIVHELLHRKFPNHHKGWLVSMGMYLPSWRDLEKQLQRYAPQRLID